VRGYAVFCALSTLGVVLLISDVLGPERHRTFNLVIVAIMFCGATLDLALWARRRRLHRRLELLRRLGNSA
jgi:hypothetical protein